MERLERTFYDMILLYSRKLDKFAMKHSDSGKSLRVWISVVERAVWKRSFDVLHDFPKPKLLKETGPDSRSLVINTASLWRWIMKMAL